MQNITAIIFNARENNELFQKEFSMHGPNIDLNFIQRQAIIAFANSEEYRQINGKINKNNFTIALVRKFKLTTEVQI